ncbi:MAG: ATP-binding protein, partial [Candidatus Marinimicrobia bacterium]|nr:ATP-binding protein [Candidatus Neomarinimicrobiota bacterium]
MLTLLTHFPCVAITGVRQCGKTTLLATFPKTWQRFDMEHSADRQQVLDDPDLFVRLHPDQIIIDEAQLVPELLPALRVAIDGDRAQKGRYILSGSSSPDLIKQISETLAGRVAYMELGPLSLAEAWKLDPAPIYNLITSRPTPLELLSSIKPRITIRQVWQYWFSGGYPEPWLNSEPDFARLWQHNYIDTFLMRDISSLFPNMNRDRYRQLILLLAQATGTILNKAEFARVLGVSEPTIHDWLQIAHGTFIWRHIPAWDRSTQKQLVKHAKGMLRDSGLLHRFLHIGSMDLLASNPVAGRSWEGMIIETLLRGFADMGQVVQPYHYRTRGGAEVDLILESEF